MLSENQQEGLDAVSQARKAALKRQKDIQDHANSIFYSDRYYDEEYEYRHVILPKALAKYIPTDRLMPEHEWRELGVKQSPGWVHYMIHGPEPHVMLFRREINYQAKYGARPGPPPSNDPAAIGNH